MAEQDKGSLVAQLRSLETGLSRGNLQLTLQIADQRDMLEVDGKVEDVHPAAVALAQAYAGALQELLGRTGSEDPHISDAVDPDEVIAGLSLLLDPAKPIINILVAMEVASASSDYEAGRELPLLSDELFLLAQAAKNYYDIRIGQPSAVQQTPL